MHITCLLVLSFVLIIKEFQWPEDLSLMSLGMVVYIYNSELWRPRQDLKLKANPALH